MYCSLGHFPISSSTTWRGFFASLLSASLSEDSCGLQQGQLEASDAVLKPPCRTTCLNTSPSSALVLSHTRLALPYQTSEWTHAVQCASYNFYNVYILLYELKPNSSLKLFRLLWLYIFWRYLLCIYFSKIIQKQSNQFSVKAVSCYFLLDFKSYCNRSPQKKKFYHMKV